MLIWRMYTNEILGFDYNTGKKALEKHIQGDGEDLEALMETAADKNDTTPEAVQEIMGEYLMN